MQELNETQIDAVLQELTASSPDGFWAQEAMARTLQEAGIEIAETQSPSSIAEEPKRVENADAAAEQWARVTIDYLTGLRAGEEDPLALGVASEDAKPLRDLVGRTYQRWERRYGHNPHTHMNPAEARAALSSDPQERQTP